MSSLFLFFMILILEHFSYHFREMSMWWGNTSFKKLLSFRSAALVTEEALLDGEEEDVVDEEDEKDDDNIESDAMIKVCLKIKSFIIFERFEK